MDYLENLKRSITNFEAETGKLAKINSLVNEVETLLAEVKKEKAALTESAARIAELKKQLSDDCKTLAEFTKREESARRQLLEEIHALVVQDTAQTVKNLTEPLTKIKSDLSVTGQDLSALVAEEKIFRRDFIDKLKATVDKNVADNAETRKKIALDLSSYLMKERQTHQELVTSIQSTVAADSKKIAEFVRAQETFQANLLRYIEDLITTKNNYVSYKIEEMKTDLTRHDTKLETRLDEIETSVENLSNKVDDIVIVLKNKRGFLF